MQKGLLIILILALLLGVVFAIDTNTQIPCITEGNIMPVYPGYACCEGLSAIPTTSTASDGTIQALVGASICSECGNGTCEQWENYTNCASDCKAPLPCAKEGEKFSLVYSDYPKQCCSGLTAWNSGMDTREVVNGACVETGRVAGSPVGTCIKCGDGICGSNENLCNCAADCNITKARLVCETDYFTPLEKDAFCKVNYNGVTASCTILASKENGHQCTPEPPIVIVEPKDKEGYSPVEGITGSYSGITCKSTESVYNGSQFFFNCNNKSETCACTLDYAPVCGVDGVTYGNACGAKCVNVEISYQGECKINQNCPQYMPPGPDFCTNGHIEVSVDEKGCKKPVCVYNVPTTGDFYKNAYWKCSNGKEYDQNTDGCMPYSFWKEKARNTCASFSTDCSGNVIPSSASSGGTSSPTQNTTANTVSPATGALTIASATSAKTIKDATSAADSPIPVSAVSATAITNNSSDCVGGEVNVIDFRVTNQCRPECKETIDSTGCKTMVCANGISTTSCPTSNCNSQSWEEIKAIKEKCNAINGQVIINFENNCNKYICLSSTSTSSGGVKPSVDVNTICTTTEMIPQEKIDYCEKNGGKFVTKTNDNNCLIFVQCMGETTSTTEQKPVNKKILTDQTKLLSLALMLETLRIDLLKTQEKVTAIAKYYAEIGDLNSAAKFTKAAGLLGQAVSGIDEIKIKIRDNVSTFSEDDAIVVRNKINDIKETMLKNALMAMLE